MQKTDESRLTESLCETVQPGGYEMVEEKRRELIREAMAARKSAYAPYSDYRVGAALLTRSGRIVTGCNVENASYGASNCAERTAVFKAVSEGERSFSGIAIVGGKGEEADGYAYPCGICRQVLQEFCGPDFTVIAAKCESDYRIFSLQELLPCGFGPATQGLQAMEGHGY